MDALDHATSPLTPTSQIRRTRPRRARDPPPQPAEPIWTPPSSPVEAERRRSSSRRPHSDEPRAPRRARQVLSSSRGPLLFPPSHHPLPTGRWAARSATAARHGESRASSSSPRSLAPAMPRSGLLASDPGRSRRDPAGPAPAPLRPSPVAGRRAEPPAAAAAALERPRPSRLVASRVATWAAAQASPAPQAANRLLCLMGSAQLG